MTEALAFLPASAEQVDPHVIAWPASNDAVIDAGLRWLEARLSGEDGSELRATYAGLRARMSAMGRPAAIDEIGSVFKLSPFEEDVLLVALAPAINGSFAPAYGAIQGRLAAAPATPHLLAKLLFSSDRLPAQAMASLGASAPLRRSHLVTFDDIAELAMSASITLPERIRLLLCGVDEPEARLASLVRTQSPVPIPARLDALADRVKCDAGQAMRFQLVGPERSGRRAFAAAMLDRLSMKTLVADEAQLSLETTSMLVRDAAIDGCGLVIESGQLVAGGVLKAIERNWTGPLFVITDAPVQGLEALPVLRLEPLAAEERAGLWQRAIPRLATDEIARLSEQFALGPDQIDGLAANPGLAAHGAWSICRDLGARDLEGLATRIAPRRDFGDMILAPETRAELAALAAQVEGRAEVHERWGYRSVLGRATGVSVLFAGPSGVGKTMAAEALAHALDLDLYVVDLARVTSKYIGETEKNLRRIFDAAEGGGAVLFFDEADALFGKRSEVKDSHDRYANAEISYLLQRMETYAGLAILATNLKAHLDTAFLRRLRMIVDFPLPDAEARLALWRRAIPESAPRGVIDWQRLARIELSGGNITTIGTNAAFRALADGQPIGMTHLSDAIASEFRKLDREPQGLAL